MTARTDKEKRAIGKVMMRVLSGEVKAMKGADEAEAANALYGYFMTATDDSLTRLYDSIVDIRVNVAILTALNDAK